MCTDERCRHPYTCDCAEQCGGQPLEFCEYCGNEGHDADDCPDGPEDQELAVPCAECGAGTWPSEGYACYACVEEAAEDLIQHLEGGMIPSDYAYGKARALAHEAKGLL